MNLTDHIVASVTRCGPDLIDAGNQAFELACAHPLTTMMAVTLLSFAALGRGGQTN
jgi:hypothetical protein